MATGLGTRLRGGKSQGCCAVARGQLEGQSKQSSPPLPGHGHLAPLGGARVEAVTCRLSSPRLPQLPALQGAGSRLHTGHHFARMKAVAREERSLEAAPDVRDSRAPGSFRHAGSDFRRGSGLLSLTERRSKRHVRSWGLHDTHGPHQPSPGACSRRQARNRPCDSGALSLQDTPFKRGPCAVTPF